MNVPGALGKIFAAFPEATTGERTLEQTRADLSGLGNMLYALGLVLFTIEAKEPTQAPADVEKLAQQRWAAKQARNFAQADALRAELGKLGWKAIDRKDGYSLEKDETHAETVSR